MTTPKDAYSMILALVAFAAMQEPTQFPISSNQATTAKVQVSKAKVAEVTAAMKRLYGGNWNGRLVQVTPSSAGDSARGIIIKEDKGELSLDSGRPCGGPIVMFSEPYKKRQVGQATCGKQTFPRYEVEQK